MAAAETLWMTDIGKILQDAYPAQRKLPTRDLPNWLVRIAANFDDRVKGVVPDLGTFHEADAGYVTSITQVKPRDPRPSLVEAGALYR